MMDYDYFSTYCFMKQRRETDLLFLLHFVFGYGEDQAVRLTSRISAGLPVEFTPPPPQI